MGVSQGQTSQAGRRGGMWSDGGRAYADRLFLQSARGGGGLLLPRVRQREMLIYEQLFTIYGGSGLLYLQQVEGNDVIVDNEGLLQTF